MKKKTEKDPQDSESLQLNVEDQLDYYGENFEMRMDIVRTILKLPEPVRNFALDRCRFVSVGKGVAGITLPGRIGSHEVEKRTRNMWIIVLDDSESREQMECSIAHEIGHAWRADDRLGNPTVDCEVQTGLLVHEWGFRGRGADVEFLRQRYPDSGRRR
jgi:hypothetical protein